MIVIPIPIQNPNFSKVRTLILSTSIPSLKFPFAFTLEYFEANLLEVKNKLGQQILWSVHQMLETETFGYDIPEPINCKRKIWSTAFFVPSQIITNLINLLPFSARILKTTKVEYTIQIAVAEKHQRIRITVCNFLFF